MVPMLKGKQIMYSVIQPIEVLDDKDEMVSTWLVLAADLFDKHDGDMWITENIEEDMVAHTWVIKTSDILRFSPPVLQYLMLDFDVEEGDFTGYESATQQPEDKAEIDPQSVEILAEIRARKARADGNNA